MIEIDKVLKGVLSINDSISGRIVRGLTDNSSEVKDGFIFFTLFENL